MPFTIFEALGEMLFILLLLIMFSVIIPVVVSLIFKRKVCECGERLESGMNFCPKCGKKIK